MGFFGVDVDITGTGAIFSDFNSSHLVLPFNGWRFVLVAPTVEITDVRLVSTTVDGLTQANVFFTSTGFALNAVNSMRGDAELAIDTRPLSAPEPSTMILLGIGLVALGRRARKQTQQPSDT